MSDRSRPRLYLLNYADDRLAHKGAVFLRAQEDMNRSARRHGVDEIVSWGWPELSDTDFFRANRPHLERPYQLNGFAFKPYITSRLLAEISHGDLVLYYDSGDGGHLIDGPLDPLVDLCIDNEGTVFSEWGDANRNWVKRDCFVGMDCDESRYHDATHSSATWFVIRKSEFTVRFVDEWLRLNLDERNASYRNERAFGLPDLEGFVEHRGDQSIISNLVVKYRLRTFRGAGGPANRRIGNFVRTLTPGGRFALGSKRLLSRGRMGLGAIKRFAARTLRGPSNSQRRR